MSFSTPYRVLALVLAFALCGVPQLVAQTAQPQSQDPAASSPNPQPAQQQPNITADPTQGPVEPAQSTTDQQTQDQPTPDQPLPNAPSSSSKQAGQPAATAAPAAQQAPAAKPQEPAGTAAAGSAETVGGAASRPAGTAIAPAKQRQVRSLLIKLGAIAAAGAALGIVYGLSKGTPSKPPGTTTAATPAP
ncbi:MAG: hypothetical protein HYX28_09895 [Candidatus Koribacter versatilis]|uniref:Uncharacterized protein n=1 Tax=Candidatus Korobacter versatilis TaxID=658062 RepID=A0A932AAD1_9BACT|nr:hypothetical protein [Candidatus Koribacter versatilis]